MEPRWDRGMDSHLPFLLASTANSTTTATSRLGRSTAPKIKGMLRDRKEQLSLVLNPAESCLPGILEKWHKDAVLGEPQLRGDF